MFQVLIHLKDTKQLTCFCFFFFQSSKGSILSQMGNLKPQVGDSPGPVVKNPPSDAVDEDLIPGQGTKIPHAERPLSPGSATGEKPT